MAMEIDLAKVEAALKSVMGELRDVIDGIPEGHLEYDGGVGTLRNNLVVAAGTIEEEQARVRLMRDTF